MINGTEAAKGEHVDGDRISDEALGAGALVALIATGFVMITVPLLVAVLVVATFLPWGTYSTQPGFARVAVPTSIMVAGLVIEPLVKIVVALVLAPWRDRRWVEPAAKVVDFAYNFLLLHLACAYLLQTTRAAVAATVLAFVLYAVAEQVMERVRPQYFRSRVG